MKLEDDSGCSAQCTGRFMSDKDPSAESFFVTGAVFGDVGGLHWTFHVRQGSIINVILLGRCKIARG